MLTTLGIIHTIMLASFIAVQAYVPCELTCRVIGSDGRRILPGALATGPVGFEGFWTVRTG
jgi:hypothetical protein